jgi:hypothetical protein
MDVIYTIMKTIDVFIPREDYQEFVERFESAKVALDALSVAVENRVRSHRSLLKRDLIQHKERIKLTIPIKDYLMPYLDEYCIIKGITRQEFITKVLKGRNI